MKTLIIIITLFIVTTINQFAQTGSINNTLGTGGSFIVKDGSNSFFRVNQLTGNAIFSKNLELGNLDNSIPTAGVITRNNKRFLHNFAPSGSEFNNLFLGLEAGNFTMGGGAASFQSSYNVGIGPNSLGSITTGYSNTAVGSRTLFSNSSGYDNTTVGYSSLYYNTDGNYNTAIGNYSLYLNVSGSENTAQGYKALFANVGGTENVALGTNALFSNTYGGLNTAIGFNSLINSQTVSKSTAIGSYSLESNTTGFGNTAVGHASLQTNTTGNGNSAFGYESLKSNLTGASNSAFGLQALSMNNSNNNTAVGYRSQYTSNSGYGNTSVGAFSLSQNSSGYNNTAIGYSAGNSITTGSNLVVLGYLAEPSTESSVNEITLGNNQIYTLRCNVQTITSLSDARDKKNVKDLSLGLDFLMKVKPREFNWDRRDWYESGIADGSKMQEQTTAGFIAQEFDSLQNTEHAEWLNLVLKNNPDKWEATYGNLLPVIVKAVQELKQKNDELVLFNQELAKQNESLKKEIEEVQLTISEQIENKIKSLLTQVSDSEDRGLNIALE